MLKAPFPWFGGKSRVADLVWERFGEVQNYVEPFFGSGAVLLKRPSVSGIETVNDADGFISNFWRSIQIDPEHVAHWATWPVNENDLHARNFYLAKKRRDFKERIEGDPEFFDPMIAGWWVWGICIWIGGQFAELCGPWESIEGRLIKTARKTGVKRQIVDLGSWNKKFSSVERRRPQTIKPKGVQKRLVHLSTPGQGVKARQSVCDWFQELAGRLAAVRVCCGDWKRLTGPSVTTKHGLTGMFLDPPYEFEGRDTRCYTEDDGVWNEVWPWCLEHGKSKKFRIALCGYEGDVGQRLIEAGWTEVPWKASGSYGSGMGGRGDENSGRERIWFSPHCLAPTGEQLEMFS